MKKFYITAVLSLALALPLSLQAYPLLSFNGIATLQPPPPPPGNHHDHGGHHPDHKPGPQPEHHHHDQHHKPGRGPHHAPHIAFSSIQKLRCFINGEEVYFYPDGICEVFQRNGVKSFSCHYNVVDNEIFLELEGGTIKGTFRADPNNRSVESCFFAGNTYYKKRY